MFVFVLYGTDDYTFGQEEYIDPETPFDNIQYMFPYARAIIVDGDNLY